MIRVHGVTRVYRLGDAEVRALAGVSLEIPEGQFVALMGPSGSGKSTLLHILGLLDRPTGGQYYLFGQDTSQLSDTQRTLLRRNTIGFVFQFFHLLARLSAAGNVELPMLFAGVPRGERRKRALEALAAVGLSHRASHRPDQLSGGERQRVALARAVVMRPKLLLADEPTGNLDRASAREIMELVQGLNRQGLTVVLVTHDPAIAAYAGRILRLSDGHVVGEEHP
ncbi:MAG: ABC transporter ATP-binding protein [Thermoanaerobaculum sp.]|nr:MAG: ABC transporter ATP-binding protein [Thermoanaerobaculum sp.]